MPLDSDKLERLRKAGMPIDALNERLVEQLDSLDDDEVSALIAIKAKLNDGLDDALRKAADPVGVAVW